MLQNRLKKYSPANANANPANPANPANVHHQNTPTLATLATLQLATLAESEVISNWWLMHFIDRKPLEVAIWPPCTLAGAFESYPHAIAAEPLPPPFTVEATPYD